MLRKKDNKRFRKLRNKLRDIFKAEVSFAMLPSNYVLVRLCDISEKDWAWASRFVFRLHEIFPGWPDYRFYPYFMETTAKGA